MGSRVGFLALVARCIQISPDLWGKGRLIQYWMRNRDRNSQPLGILPGGGLVFCDLHVPYEAMVYCRQEERAELRLLSRLLQPGQTFVDCGANIGVWTIVAARSVGPQGWVHAFEPSPTTFERLRRNVSLLPRSEGHSVRLYPVALGNTEGLVEFECRAEHNLSRVISADATGERVTSVRVTMLDTTLGDAATHGIKVDVEGFELEVLKGARRVLARSRPWICVEFNTLIAGANVLGQWAVHRFLTELRYECREAALARRGRLGPVLPDSWRVTGYRNLLYTPAGRVRGACLDDST